MRTINNIPVYEAEITNEVEGMLRISLVDNPAVESLFQAFGNKYRMQKFAIQNEEKRLVNGVLMRADFPIYRYSKDEGEYYVVYSKEVIRKMAEKYLSESRQNNVDLDHDGNQITGVDMVQIFIKDSKKGITPAGFDEIEDGSLFAEYHVSNDDIWNEIKEGTYKGFSLEGYFSFTPMEFNLQHKKEMKNNRFKQFLASVLAKFANITTDKGVIAWDGDEELKVGDKVYIQDESGEMLDIEDGDYIKEDGTTIKVADGAVTEIIEKKEEIEEATEEVKAEEVENPTNEGEETDTEAIVKLREEMDEIYKRVDELTKAVDELTKSVEDIKGAMTNMSAAAPAHEEFKEQIREKTGNKNLDKVANAIAAFKKRN